MHPYFVFYLSLCEVGLRLILGLLSHYHLRISYTIVPCELAKQPPIGLLGWWIIEMYYWNVLFKCVERGRSTLPWSDQLPMMSWDMQYNTIVLEMSSHGQCDRNHLAISTDCSTLVPKPHPHPKKEGPVIHSLFPGPLFPNHKLPYNHDVKYLYALLLSSTCSFPDQEWFLTSACVWLHVCYPLQ